MLERDNFSAWVEIEGVVAHEYNVEVKEDEKLVTCWIASEEGKSFSVHIKDIKDASCSITTGWRLDIDGVKTGFEIFEPPSRLEGDLQQCEQSCCFQTARVSPTERRSFTFSKMDTTDDDEYLNHSNDLNVGEITLRVGTHRRGGIGPIRFVQLPNEPIHEKSKKSGTHCLGLGTAQLVECETTSRLWNHLQHLATFSFKYRPLGLLQANGIAPPPAPISVSPEPEENDTISAEEEELKRQMQTMQERLAELEKSRGAKRVKEEPDIASKRAQKRVKKELKSTFVPGEVIDLTSE